MNHPAEHGSLGLLGKFSAMLGLTTVIAAVQFPVIAFAQEQCLTQSCDGQVVKTVTGENTERESMSDAAGVGDKGFSISVDGEQIAGTQNVADEQRKTDVALEAVDIQIKFDGLDVKPVLNVSTTDLRSSYKSGEVVQFNATSNYPAWIKKSEVLVYEQGADGSTEPLAALEVDAEGQASWQMPTAGADDYVYVLRVYDEENRYDETKSRSLRRTSADFITHKTSETVKSAGEGEDFTARRNIQVFGGAVTVFGRNVPEGYVVNAIDENIVVDAGNSFVTQQILPPGDHEIGVSVKGLKDDGLSFKRKLNIPSNDWFYVALADLTLGRKFGSGKLIAPDPSEFDNVYTKGRLAFYLKGKIQGKYLLTAAADTSEDKLSNLFKGLDSKDPRQFLRRIDPNDFYPVYGDDSTSVEDAPTRGKFYVRLERGDSRVMWGNFKAKINGAELLRNERALYGANAVYRSQAATSFGERKFEANAYAAQPETLPQRDVLRGTGGSAYFLKRQDIVTGSETVTVEIRDRVTGRVISRRTLVAGADYEINPIQGVIILKRPLSGIADTGGTVRDGTTGGGVANLVVQYEYTPTSGQLDGYSYGGRAQGWLGEHLRFGATSMREQTGTADQELLGADIMLRHSEKTFLKAEIAQSSGPGFGRTTSIDGGLTFDDVSSVGDRSRTARAYTLEGQIDLADVTKGRANGLLGAYYEKKEAGFSTLDEDIRVDQTGWGLSARFDPTDYLSLTARYDDFNDAAGKEKREVAAEITYEINEYWKATLGVKHVGLATPGGKPKENGNRTDIGAQITYSPDDDNAVYVFGQATVARSGGLERNDRIGVGGETKLTEKVGLTGEVSYGANGIGALAAITYDPSADDHYYVGYRLDPDRIVSNRTLDGVDLGGIVIGAKSTYSDVLTGFAENNYDMFGKRRSLTSTYGVTYTPDALWTAEGALEFGKVVDVNSDDIERRAVSLSIGYQDEEHFSAKVRGEARVDDSEDDLRDRQTYLTAASLSWKTNTDWRFIANLDAVISNSDQSSTLDGDYIEASIGYAYRPVLNDRFNMLLKYAFIYDLPGPQQVNVNGDVLGPSQRSHIFSVDASYDITQYLTLGAKYGFRIGEVSSTRGSDDFTESSAHLGIVRADVHVVENWDALLEGRVLHSPTSSSTDFGALAAVYRHFGENVKVGAGYNFGHFSDDLRDLTYDDQGPFINVIGSF